jgi:anti-anti-sigma factor
MKTVRADDTITHVALIGRLNVHGVNQIQYDFNHMMTLLPKPTIVDISEVSYIASLGLSMLVSTAKYLERHGVKMVLLAPSATVRETFEASCLHDLIPIANEEPAALALLR